jgi:hypothetical protein
MAKDSLFTPGAFGWNRGHETLSEQCMEQTENTARPGAWSLIVTVVTVVTVITVAPATAQATAQVAERLVYKGKTLQLFSEPLEWRFSQGSPTYWQEPMFGRSGRRPRAFKATSTACWRGYQGTWKIERGYLWLVALHECGFLSDKGQAIPISKVFPKEKAPLKATWYSGVLRAPLGKMLRYVHMGFHSSYEKDLFIAVRGGKVKGVRTIDNRDPAAVRRGSGFRVRPSADDRARALISARRDLQRCARKGRQRGPVEVEIQPNGSVSSIKLGGPLPGTAPGRCIFAALARVRYPGFYGPPVRSQHQLP